jgi:hypothetical protein
MSQPNKNTKKVSTARRPATPRRAPEFITPMAAQIVEQSASRRTSRPSPTSAATTGLADNVQASVDAEHHLIVTHEVVNEGHDRAQLTVMAQQTRDTLGTKDLTVLADHGYFSGEEILKCEQAGMTPGAEADAFWARRSVGK